jgi:hypothetical protein
VVLLTRRPLEAILKYHEYVMYFAAGEVSADRARREKGERNAYHE